MVTLISHNPEETIALGEDWGRHAQTGWVIGLSGELGAGKTQLVKGIAQGLGITSRVLSPTFNLVHQYEGRLPLFHLDLYRLETPAQIIGAGLEEYFYQPRGVTVIEWVERWLGEDPRSAFMGPAAPGPAPLGSAPLGSAPLGPAPLGPPLDPAPLVYRRVLIESLSETERRITYDDSGA